MIDDVHITDERTLLGYTVGISEMHLGSVIRDGMYKTVRVFLLLGK